MGTMTQLRRKFMPLAYSIGGWCLMSSGADPFGEATRKLAFRQTLEATASAGIKYISVHDGDLWAPGASWETICGRIDEVLQWCAELGLEVLNFTSNTFSHPAFRSGAFSSPFKTVREATLAQGMLAMKAAQRFGAKNVIFWGGREGDDGAHANDAGIGTRRYLQGIALCVIYARDYLGYTPGITVEPKQYEPRLMGLYANMAATVLAAVKIFDEDPLIRQISALLKINPEYPQHVGMLCMSQVMELELLLQMNRVADFIHIGGQIPGRMDCDLPPYWGDNNVANVLTAMALQRKGWPGVYELDCRPPRTTTTLKGMAKFLEQSVAYLNRSWQLADTILDDEEVNQLYAAMNDDAEPEVLTQVLTGDLPAVYLDSNHLARHAGAMLVMASDVDTDCIEAYAQRVNGLIMGYAS